MKNTERKEIIANAELLAGDISAIKRSLEIVENGLLFAGERKDKDMPRAAAAALCLLASMLEDCEERASNIAWELDRDGKGEA